MAVVDDTIAATYGLGLTAEATSLRPSATPIQMFRNGMASA